MNDLSSTLDVETTHLLWERLFMKRDQTCLLVSHRRFAFQHADHIVEWFQTSPLTGILAVWYGRSMNAVYLGGEIKTPGWMIHRNRNRNTSTFAA